MIPLMHHDQIDPDNFKLLNIQFIECQVQYSFKLVLKVQCSQVAVFQFQFQWIISVKCKDHYSSRKVDLCCVADNP